MIIDSKRPIPDDQLPPDAPPSYDALDSLPRFANYPPEKSPIPSLSPPPTSPSSSSSIAGGSNTPLSSKAAGKRPSTRAPRSSNWFSFGASRTMKEVRTTVIGLVRDLVREQNSGHGASGILDSCAEACNAYDLSLSSTLQEKSIEGHTPIYWAIVKRPAEPPNPDDYDLVTALLFHSSPLTSTTVSDIRLACLMTSDQALFQRLRLSPVFSPLSGTDEMLLGGSIPQDTISVGDVEGDASAFVANFEILSFQKRMRVSKRIDIEFIAKGRMWRLAFAIAPTSKWVVTLGILEHSPATWIDSRLLIEEPPQHFTGSAPATSWFNRFPTSQEQSSNHDEQNVSRKPKSTISLRLKTGSTQLIAQAPHSSRSSGWDIVVELEDSLLASNLQYDGCTYYSAEGTLSARLEARLAKPEAECVIC